MNLEGPEVCYDCSYYPGPTSLPVVSEGLRRDLGYEERCVHGREIETLDQGAMRITSC